MVLTAPMYLSHLGGDVSFSFTRRMKICERRDSLDSCMKRYVATNHVVPTLKLGLKLGCSLDISPQLVTGERPNEEYTVTKLLEKEKHSHWSVTPLASNPSQVQYK